LEDEPLSYQPVILNDILRRCESHLASGSEASQHFRNVCRALVTQALELSTFLRKTKEVLNRLANEADFLQHYNFFHIF